MTSSASESRRPRAVPAGLVVAVVMLTAVVGCSKPVKLVPAGGTVQIGGKAADGIVVQFMPQPVAGEKRPTSFATTDADGRFTLRTYDGKDGAVVGQHAVTLVDTLEERPAQGQRFTKPPRLDSRYATMGGGLTASVVEGGPTIEIAVPAASQPAP